MGVSPMLFPVSDPNANLDPDLQARLAAKQKLHPDYASPYDRPVQPRRPRSGYFALILYVLYWLLIPLIILALIWYIRSALAPFLNPAP
jgi:hypothetical protein